MEELLRQIFGYLRGAWRFRWWGLAATWIVGIVAGIVVLYTPDRWESTARVYVNTQPLEAKIRSQMGESSGQINLSQYAQQLSQELVSRPNMNKLIDDTDIKLEIRNQKQRDTEIEKLIESITVRSTNKNNLFNLSYINADPQRARIVVQSLVGMFTKMTAENDSIQNSGARTYLEERKDYFNRKVQEAERLKTEFEQRVIVDPNTTFAMRMYELETQLNTAKMEQAQAQQSLAAFQRTVGVENGKTWLPEFDEPIATLDRQLKDLLLNYTADHPTVRNMQRMLDDLKAQREKAIAEIRDNGGSSAPTSNPAVLAVQQQFAAYRAAVATANAKVSALQTQVNLGKDTAANKLAEEAQLKQLTRDYDLYKTEYDKFTKQLEQMPAGSGFAALEFRVVDPANLPREPAAPTRVMLMVAAGLLALVAGAGFSFLISQLKPTFDDAQTLGEVLGLPVLGAVSALVSPGAKRRQFHSLLGFSGGVAGFVVVVGAAAVVLMLRMQ